MKESVESSTRDFGEWYARVLLEKPHMGRFVEGTDCFLRSRLSAAPAADSSGPGALHLEVGPSMVRQSECIA